MIWEDPRTVDLIESNTLSDPTYICQAWCSTEQGTDILLEELGVPNNSTGQAACCDNVFVPGSIAQNVIGYDVQASGIPAIAGNQREPSPIFSFLQLCSCTPGIFPGIG